MSTPTEKEMVELDLYLAKVMAMSTYKMVTWSDGIYNRIGQSGLKCLLNGRQPCHSCDNPPCINPHHLFAGTQKQNLEDMRIKGRENNVGPKGSNNPKSIYSSDQVYEMRKRFGFGEKISALQKQFGGTYQSIHAIVHWRNWRHLNSNH